MRTILFAIFAMFTVFQTSADPVDFSGSISAELRYFVDDPAFSGQLEDLQASFALEPELRWRSEDRRHRVAVELFARLDVEDSERSHIDVREASWRFVGDDFDLLAGVHRVFWGVTESRHLVDVINQVDGLENLDEEDRLGQPMIMAAIDRDWGRLEILGLIGFREREFPGEEGRLRAPLPVGEARYESAAGDERIDAALRWTQVFGDVDIGVHLFHGTGREPSFSFDPERGELSPYYALIDQIGLDAQWTKGAWLYKLEAIGRSGQGSDFGAAVLGFERTLYQLGSSAADLGLIVELLWDDRDPSAPATAFDDDLFVGARLALNDAQDSSLLAGFVVDRHSGSRIVRLEAERRLGTAFTVELEGWWFAGLESAETSGILRQDSHFEISLGWHF